MPDFPAQDGPPDYLLFEGNPIHILMHQGVPWFASDDLCAAMNRNAYALEYVNGPRFPDFARVTVPEYDDEGQEIGKVPFLSPVGVWYFAHDTDPTQFQKLSAWAKRESLALCPDADPKDPAMFLTLLPSGELPPCPKRYSGRGAEWWALKDSNEYLDARANRIRGRFSPPSKPGGVASSSAPTAPKPPGILDALDAQLREARRSR